MKEVNPPAIVREDADLDALAAKINEEHVAGEQASNEGAERFLRCGVELLKAKMKCPHGRWEHWLASKTLVPGRRARRYMQLARGRVNDEFDLEHRWKILCGNVDDPEEPKTVVNDRFADLPPVTSTTTAPSPVATNGAAGGSGGNGLVGAKPKKQKAKKPPPREALTDREGNEVPARCRDAWADEGLANLIGEVTGIEATLHPQSLFDRAAKYTTHYPFVLVAEFQEHIFEALRRIQLAREMLEAGLPHAVCPRCQAEEKAAPCRYCRGAGLVPAHRYSELKRESL